MDLVRKSDILTSQLISLAAAMFVGSWVAIGNKGVFLPIWLAIAGILASLIGVLIVKARKQTNSASGLWTAAILMALATYFLIKKMGFGIDLYYCFLAGLAVGLFIEKITSPKLMAVVGSILAIAVLIFLSYQWGQLFGLALAVLGLISVAWLSFGQGLAASGAMLVVLVLVFIYAQLVKLPLVDLMNPQVLIGLLLGGLMSFIFSSTKKIFWLVLLAMAAPVLVGFFLGKAALAGLLIGALVRFNFTNPIFNFSVKSMAVVVLIIAFLL